jgi:exodeoxyribonuclease V alpha subunit
MEAGSMGPSVLGVVARTAPSLRTIPAQAVASWIAGETRGLDAAVGRCLDAGEAGPDDVTLAWELARLVDSGRRPLAFALALLVLDAASRGSTRLLVRGRIGEIAARAVTLGIERDAVTDLGALFGDGGPPVGVQPRAQPPRAGRTRGVERAPGAQLELQLFDGPVPEPGPSGLPEGQGPEVDRARLELLAPLVGESSRAILGWDGEGLALLRWAEIERRISALLAERAGGLAERAALLAERAHELARADEEAARALVASLRAEPLAGPRGAVALTDEQETAVAAVLSERTVVLTGGPGTGKTSIVVAMLRALARRDGPACVADVALAAPTGKAADRLGESVRTAIATSAAEVDRALAAAFRPPTTLHRLLGYRPVDGSFRAHRHNRLAQRVVIVDEASMIDAALFERLLAAVAPDATLVLLGDPDQLPSVDPGAVLRDLVRARADGTSARVVELTRSHRMDPTDPDGAHVLSVARACLEPSTWRSEASTAVGFRVPPPGTSPVGMGGALSVDAGRLLETLDAWVGRHVLVPELEGLDGLSAELGPDEAPPEVVAALAHLARARLLAVTRRTAEELDGYVGARVAQRQAGPRGARGPSRSGADGRGGILPGEPVMVVRNDYDEDLWNGDSGVAWRTARGELRASFRRGARILSRPLAGIGHLVERAHAVTVHKAQGSEHDEVMLVLPPLDGPLLCREIVYTAITRARRSAVVVGRPELLAAALARRGERDTGLPLHLARGPAR